jgi:hypothetical protein
MWLMWLWSLFFKQKEVRKENLQTNLSEKSQTWDGHVHIKSQSSQSITCKLFPQTDTYHNIDNEGLIFAMHHIKDRGFTLSSST